MSNDHFEQFVAEALDALPEFFQAKLDNVDIIIEDWADPATLHRAGVRYPAHLLGFYHGVPQSRRTRHYGLVLPDKISIYRGAIAMRCRTTEEMRQTVHHVLYHEIAHHFGISDERLKVLGVYDPGSPK
jgi:predicted Zn-dependent protease with MMP-like domain